MSEPQPEPIEAELVDEPAAAPGPATADYNERGVPSLDHLRDKIERRYASSLGVTELAAETPEARALEEQAAERDEAARAKLEEIRKSLRDG